MNLALREAPDVETASDAYARRFAGAVGTRFLEIQQTRVRELLDGLPADATICDVGGGHAQVALALAACGYRVTVTGSDRSCRRRLGDLDFVAAPLHELPFRDGAFDVAISIRALGHLERWEPFAAELCRIARHAVILDFASSRSLNRFAPGLFGLKRRIEGDTRPFTVFDPSALDRVFTASGFRTAARRPQFFLPMALYRLLGTVWILEAVERPAARLGLTRRFGSPLLIRADRIREEAHPEAGMPPAARDAPADAQPRVSAAC